MKKIKKKKDEASRGLSMDIPQLERAIGYLISQETIETKTKVQDRMLAWKMVDRKEKYKLKLGKLHRKLSKKIKRR